MFIEEMEGGFMRRCYKFGGPSYGGTDAPYLVAMGEGLPSRDASFYTRPGQGFFQVAFSCEW